MQAVRYECGDNTLQVFAPPRRSNCFVDGGVPLCVASAPVGAQTADVENWRKFMCKFWIHLDSLASCADSATQAAHPAHLWYCILVLQLQQAG